MFRWLRRWLGYEEEPWEEIVGGLSDPEAAMRAEALRNEGVQVVVKSASPLLGELARTATDFALHVRASNAARARDVLAPLLRHHADASRQPRRFRRGRGSR